MDKDKAIKEIKQLKELLDSGILTQDEYDVKSADLKKIILDSENKKNGDKKTQKEYWEKKADEKTKATSPIKSSNAVAEKKETIKSENSLKNISDDKTPLIKLDKSYDSERFKRVAIIQTIICFVLCYLSTIYFQPSWGVIEAFGTFLFTMFPAIIYLIVKRNKKKDISTFFALQFTILALSSIGDYFALETSNNLALENSNPVQTNSNQNISVKLYEYNGQIYTKEWVENAAIKNEMTFENFIRSKGIKEYSSNKKKEEFINEGVVQTKKSSLPITRNLKTSLPKSIKGLYTKGSKSINSSVILSINNDKIWFSSTEGDEIINRGGIQAGRAIFFDNSGEVIDSYEILNNNVKDKIFFYKNGKEINYNIIKPLLKDVPLLSFDFDYESYDYIDFFLNE